MTDAHLNPGGLRAPSFHNPYPTDEAPELYRMALERCVEGGADALALLGDLSHLGDLATLARALCAAAETGLPVFAVPGNHDASERADALRQAIRRVGAKNLCLATQGGEFLAEGIRMAGLSVWSENWGLTCRTAGAPKLSAWGDEAVVLLSHYPMVSSEVRLARAGLKYAGDVEDLETVARPLLRRRAPTVVLSGHLHVRDTSAEASVLQLSFAALVEPPFEVAYLDIEEEGGRVALRRRSVPVAPSGDGARLPVLSPAREGWVFEAGAWGREEAAPGGEAPGAMSGVSEKGDAEMSVAARGRVG